MIKRLTGRTSTPRGFAEQIAAIWDPTYDPKDPEIQIACEQIAARDAELAPKSVTGQTFEEERRNFISICNPTTAILSAWEHGWNAALATRDARIERAMDLVRYARHFLHNEGLISDEEYAAIVEDNEGGKRVARLEGYDSLIETAMKLAKKWRTPVASSKEALEAVYQQCADELLRAFGRKVEP
jgi:hypothetical protein